MNELNFDKLTGNGWKQFKDFLNQSDIAFYQTFAGHEECRCIDRKAQELLEVWDWSVKNNLTKSKS